MSQNKYMHPRNIYRQAPNFKELAIAYPEFRKYSKQDIAGKVTIDFKNEEALRALTTTLLKKDFGLEVEIPLNRLIPALPLRLNYLLWIEDLIQQSKVIEKSTIIGVDIGTGASCIYPLLAAKTNKWKMLATELDTESTDFAKRNVEHNGLEELITVKQVKGGTILKGALDTDETYDFTMCNPPFFSNEKEVDSSSKSRSPSRPVPHNVKTGILEEVMVEGGEMAFILQMIKESAELRNVVKIFTTMVGHKSNAKNLKSELIKIEKTNITMSEFCQGRTTRWGLAWSFNPKIKFETSLPKSKKKDKPPMKHIIPVPAISPLYTIDTVKNKLKELFTRLEIECKEIKNNKNIVAIEILARKNTWSHQRRKRREEKKEENKNILPERDRYMSIVNSEHLNSSSNTKEISVHTQQYTDVKGEKRLIDNIAAQSENDSTSKKLKICDQKNPEVIDPERLEAKSAARFMISHCYKVNTDIDINTGVCSHSQQKDVTGQETINQSCVLKAMVSLKMLNAEFHIEMAWLDGSCGRDGLHQVLQYIKNNFKLE